VPREIADHGHSAVIADLLDQPPRTSGKVGVTAITSQPDGRERGLDRGREIGQGQYLGEPIGRLGGIGPKPVDPQPGGQADRCLGVPHGDRPVQRCLEIVGLVDQEQTWSGEQRQVDSRELRK